MLEVSRERTGWRDEALSRRHREWGYDVPAADLDFVLVEYDAEEPKAIIEYKHEAAPVFVSGSSGLRVLAKLGDLAGLPAYLVRYDTELAYFNVRGLNERGRAFCPQADWISERAYVTFLYALRGRPLPPGLSLFEHGTER